MPFYVALPLSTVDMDCASGADIPIEERDAAEVLTVYGVDAAGEGYAVNLAAAGTRAANPAFDITPAGLVSALVTEQGVLEANSESLAGLIRLISRARPGCSDFLVQPDMIDTRVFTPLESLLVITDEAAVFDVAGVGVHLTWRDIMPWPQASQM